MYGAIFGDIVGSIYEFNNHRDKEFRLFTTDCFATDDSIMSLCVGKAVMDSFDGNGWDYDKLSELAREYMQDIGQHYPDCGYGGNFYYWIMEHQTEPYNSFGNGAAMRVTACGEVARNIEEAEALAEAVTRVSHNHPEGIKGAKAVAVAIFLAKKRVHKSDILDYIRKNYYPDYAFMAKGFDCDSIRKTYQFNETCQDTVPQALECFFEASDFEDAIRNAISIGGDSDTIAAITGSVAEAYFGKENIPSTPLKRARLHCLDDRLEKMLTDWNNFVYNLSKEYK